MKVTEGYVKDQQTHGITHLCQISWSTDCGYVPYRGPIPKEKGKRQQSPRELPVQTAAELFGQLTIKWQILWQFLYSVNHPFVKNVVLRHKSKSGNETFEKKIAKRMQKKSNATKQCRGKKGRKKTNKTAVVSYVFLFVLLFRFVLFTLLKWAAFYRCQNSRNPFFSRLFFSNVIWFRIKLVIIKVPSPSNYSNNTMFHSNWNNGDKSWKDLLSNPGSI